VPRGRGVQVGTIFAEGPPPKIREAKIRRDLRQLSTLIANISRTDPHMENRKSSWSTTTLVHKQKSYRQMLMHPEPSVCVLCKLAQIHSPGGVASSGIWTTQNCLCSWTCGAGRPHVGLCHIFLVLYSIEMMSLYHPAMFLCAFVTYTIKILYYCLTRRNVFVTKFTSWFAVLGLY